MNPRSVEIFLCSELVEIRDRTDPGAGVALAANLEEISVNGATLLLERPLRREATIEIVCQGGVLRGTVAGWACDELGYSTWVEFSPDSRWSPDCFCPHHFLDPATMASRELEKVA